MAPDPWIRVLTATKEDNVADDKVIKLVGPTFKVDVEVEGVKTRALVDNGSQVTLVRGELLPKIREHNGWTLGQCHQKNRPMETQPIGASGQDLGASSVVAIETRIEQTGRKFVIPWFVMTSAKPIWQGNVKDCAMVLGTNALVEFGFQLVHTDGSVVSPATADPIQPVVTAAAQVVLAYTMHLAPGQTKLAKVNLVSGKNINLNGFKLISPKEGVLAERTCDFAEEL